MNKCYSKDIPSTSGNRRNLSSPAWRGRTNGRLPQRLMKTKWGVMFYINITPHSIIGSSCSVRRVTEGGV